MLKLRSLDIHLKPTPDLSTIKKLQCNLHTFLSCKRHSCIAFRKSILILVNFNFLASCIHVDSQNTCLCAKIFNFLVGDIHGKTCDINKSVKFCLIPFLFLFLCSSFGFFSIFLPFGELLFGKFSLIFLFYGFFVAFEVGFLIELE